MKANEIFSASELRSWTQPSDVRGWLAVLTDWSLIGMGLFACAKWPFIWVIVPAMALIGGRILALGILMHECAHRSLFRTRALNDWVGNWLCAYPTWQDLPRYRAHHLRHHALSGTPDDPDLDLVTAYPASPRSLVRKFLRDLFGITGLKRVIGLLAVDFGFYEYTVSGVSSEVPGAMERSWAEVLRVGVSHLYGVVSTQLIFFGVLWLLGEPWLYGVWAGAYLIFLSVWVRIRSMAEHAVTEMHPDPLRSTRTTLTGGFGGGLARLSVAPHRVNFHLEHHLIMTVPYFRLPALHRELLARGVLERGVLAPSYWAVLRAMVRR